MHTILFFFLLSVILITLFVFISDFDDLESKIITNLNANHLNNGRLFSKLFIVTESIYSVDGTIINLPKLIEIKKKYKVTEGNLKKRSA